jgi:hypothetical protein
MTITDKMFKGYPAFKDLLGRQMRFIRYNEDENYLKCFEIKNESVDYGEAYPIQLHPQEVETKVLERLNLMDQLPVGLRDKIENREENVVEVRRKRSKYEHLPRNINCVRCSKVDYLPPSILMKQVKIDGEDNEDNRKKLDDYLSVYTCSVCVPRKRGRKKK